jgi:hypothetical protein
MVPQWLLIVESVILGLLLLLCLPVWALIPVLFGVKEDTPSGQARRVYVLLLLFPVVAIGAMVGAFMTESTPVFRWVFVIFPLLHLMVLFLVRIRH